MLNINKFDGEKAPDGSSVSENFVRWFGASQAKGKDGAPLVLFRGDKKSVDVFDRNERRETGLFLALEEDRAAMYGPAKPYYLRMENPLDLRDTFGKWMKGGPVKDLVEVLFDSHYKGDHCPHSGEPYDLSHVINGIEGGYLWKMDHTGGFYMRAWRDLQVEVENHGYDGLIIQDDGEGLGVGTSYVVFQQEQIKSADRNMGYFSLDNPSSTDNQEVLRALRAKSLFMPTQEQALTSRRLA